jgi:ornithine--oxo-acid transaminase
LVLDEVQTGMYRTGPFLAAHRYRVQPDIVVLAKALSGGLMPVGAVLMSEAVSDSVFSSLGRAFVHASTFGENSLSMRAGLATLDVLQQERLGERAETLGNELRRRLSEALAPYEMVKAVRGAGMLSGIEFQAPQHMRLRLPFEAFRRIHPAMFGQILVMRLFRDKNMLTQICGNNYMVLKVAPPLVVTESQIDERVLGRRSRHGAPLGEYLTAMQGPRRSAVRPCTPGTLPTVFRRGGGGPAGGSGLIPMLFT